LNILETAAELMAVSARTAPKAAGNDFVEIKVIGKEMIEKLADEMINYGKESGKKNFDRDGENVRESEQVLLLSLNEAKVLGLNCGACGYETCEKLEIESGPEFDGPICAWRLMDLGIALGSAVKTASILNVDNRIMYRIGVAAKKMNLIDGEVVVGVPISASGKNIYFDR
jgi:uncharacterized ferredoxin-like protein